jgi:hypothetical protein
VGVDCCWPSTSASAWAAVLKVLNLRDAACQEVSQGEPRVDVALQQ